LFLSLFLFFIFENNVVEKTDAFFNHQYMCVCVCVCVYIYAFVLFFDSLNLYSSFFFFLFFFLLIFQCF
jgi:hypothetical protein